MNDLVTKYCRLQGKHFRHHSGRIYQLNCLANIDSTDLGKFPVLCVYMSKDDYKIWARPIQEFDKNFELVT